MIAFLIWLAAGCFFTGFGIYAFCSKKDTAIGFWANAEMFPVDNIRAYNRAVGKLFCAFGIVFIILGLPLLKGQGSPFILFSVIGVMIEVISVMVIYVIVIETKYRKK